MISKNNHLILIKIHILIYHFKKFLNMILIQIIINKFLIINNIINYKYDNLKNDINRLTHLYEFYNNDNNILSYSITLNNHDFGITSNSDKIF